MLPKEPYKYDLNSTNKYKVAAIDYGIKNNILRLLNDTIVMSLSFLQCY